jgi:hypothetical protein
MKMKKMANLVNGVKRVLGLGDPLKPAAWPKYLI